MLQDYAAGCDSTYDSFSPKCRREISSRYEQQDQCDYQGQYKEVQKVGAVSMPQPMKQHR